LGGGQAHTLFPLPVLEHLHGHEGSATGDDLVAELSLVVILLVGLVVVVLGVAWGVLESGRPGWVRHLTETEHVC
jgi:hypothetical protein